MTEFTLFAISTLMCQLAARLGDWPVAATFALLAIWFSTRRIQPERTK